MIQLPAIIHKRFMQRALAVASQSPDPSRKVGMVITRFSLFEIASACNTLDIHALRAETKRPGLTIEQYLAEHPEILTDRETKYRMIKHAEVNAINAVSRLSKKVGAWWEQTPFNFANRSKGYLNWVTCNPCGGVLMSNKVRHLICLEPEQWVEEKWGSFYENVDRLVDAGIKVDFIGKRLDAKDVKFYDRLVSYDEIKRRDGHTPKPLPPHVPFV